MWTGGPRLAGLESAKRPEAWTKAAFPDLAVGTRGLPTLSDQLFNLLAASNMLSLAARLDQSDARVFPDDLNDLGISIFLTRIERAPRSLRGGRSWDVKARGASFAALELIQSPWLWQSASMFFANRRTARTWRCAKFALHDLPEKTLWLLETVAPDVVDLA